MRSYSYQVVDVFSDEALAGNPLAVFLDAAGLDDDDMQTIARELNLSETAYVFAPRDGSDALAAVRIFTPSYEMAFAGHPTIGTAYALVGAGRVPPAASTFVLDEVVGPVPIELERRQPFFAWLRMPPIALGATCDRVACAAALGLEAHDLLGAYPAQLAGASRPFLYVPLADATTVDRAELDARALRSIAPDAIGIFPFAPQPGGVYARMLAPDAGVSEDPATGSATGPLGAYLHAHGLIERRNGATFVNEQGVRMKRRSLVHAKLHCRSDGSLEAVDVGGAAVAVIEATLTLPR